MSVDQSFPCPVCEKGEVRFVPLLESTMEVFRWACDNRGCAQQFIQDTRWIEFFPLSLCPLDRDIVFHWDQNRGQWKSTAKTEWPCD